MILKNLHFKSRERIYTIDFSLSLEIKYLSASIYIGTCNLFPSEKAEFYDVISLKLQQLFTSNFVLFIVF